MVRLLRFRPAERTRLEEPLAVALEFHGSNAADLAQRISASRPAHHHLGERAVGEYNIRRHLLLARDGPSKIA